MSPMNPGGMTNYRQQDELAEKFVDAAKSHIGRVCCGSEQVGCVSAYQYRAWTGDLSKSLA